MNKTAWASLMDESIYGQAYVGPVTVFSPQAVGEWYLVKLPYINGANGMLFSRNLMARIQDLIFDDN